MVDVNDVVDHLTEFVRELGQANGALLQTGGRSEVRGRTVAYGQVERVGRCQFELYLVHVQIGDDAVQERLLGLLPQLENRRQNRHVLQLVLRRFDLFGLLGRLRVVGQLVFVLVLLLGQVAVVHGVQLRVLHLAEQIRRELVALLALERRIDEVERVQLAEPNDHAVLENVRVGDLEVIYKCLRLRVLVRRHGDDAVDVGDDAMLRLHVAADQVQMLPVVQGVLFASYVRVRRVRAADLGERLRKHVLSHRLTVLRTDLDEERVALLLIHVAALLAFRCVVLRLLSDVEREYAQALVVLLLDHQRTVVVLENVLLNVLAQALDGLQVRVLVQVGQIRWYDQLHETVVVRVLLLQAVLLENLLHHELTVLLGGQQQSLVGHVLVQLLAEYSQRAAGLLTALVHELLQLLLELLLSSSAHHRLWVRDRSRERGLRQFIVQLLGQLLFALLAVLQFALFLALLQLLLLAPGQFAFERVVARLAVQRLAVVEAGQHGLLVHPAQQKATLSIVLVPVQLNDQRLLGAVQLALLAALVYLVERVLGEREHANVWSELLDQRLDHVVGGCGRRDSNALCGDLLTSILEVESHHTSEFQVLEREEKKVN